MDSRVLICICLKANEKVMKMCPGKSHCLELGSHNLGAKTDLGTCPQ